MHLALITRPALDETNRLFEAACARLGIAHVPVIPAEAAGAGLGVAPGRRLLYRAATDRAAELVEKLVFRQGSVALHDPHFGCDHRPILLRQMGIPMPRAVHVPAERTARLEAQVEWLGGFPVAVKHPYGHGISGVSRAGSIEELKRQVAVAGGAVMIEAFVPHERSWRLTVLGGRLIAATARKPAAYDFRTSAPGSTLLPDTEPSARAVSIALSAAEALRFDFGCAEILESPDGRLSLISFDFPFAFAEESRLTGVDIAGAILEWLVSKAERETEVSARPAD